MELEYICLWRWHKHGSVDLFRGHTCEQKCLRNSKEIFVLCEFRRTMVMTFVKNISFTENDGGIMGVILMSGQIAITNIVHLRYRNSFPAFDWRVIYISSRAKVF